jgi:VanZ family protein
LRHALQHPPPRRGAWPAVTIAVALIAVATLLPGGPDTRTPGACLSCGSRALADAILNVALYAPLGAALGLAGVTTRRTILLGTVLSGTIELAQRWIPGRDASAGDVLSNVLGVTLGIVLVVTAKHWLQPTPRRSRMLAGGWTAGAVLATWATGVLLQPSFPSSTYFGQWTPDLGHLAWYRARVLTARIGTVAVPDGPAANSDTLRALLNARAAISVRAAAGPPVPTLGSLFSIYDDRHREIMLLGPDRDDLVYRFRTRAETLALDSPDMRARGALRGIRQGDPLEVVVYERDGRTCFSLNGRSACPRPIDPLAGWSLLFYAPHFPPWVIACLDAAWLVLLAAPIGYWGARGAPLLIFGGAQLAAVIHASPPHVASAGWATLRLVVAVALGAIIRLAVARRAARRVAAA